MKNSIFLVIALLVAAAMFIDDRAEGAELKFTNKTDYTTRIVELRNKCDGYLTKEQVILAPGESWTVKQTTPVIHTYTVCGGGLCSSSAFGLAEGSKYQLNLTTKGGMIDLESVPDHWKNTNIECPKVKRGN